MKKQMEIKDEIAKIQKEYGIQSVAERERIKENRLKLVALFNSQKTGITAFAGAK